MIGEPPANAPSGTGQVQIRLSDRDTIEQHVESCAQEQRSMARHRTINTLDNVVRTVAIRTLSQPCWVPFENDSKKVRTRGGTKRTMTVSRHRAKATVADFVCERELHPHLPSLSNP